VGRVVSKKGNSSKDILIKTCDSKRKGIILLVKGSNSEAGGKVEPRKEGQGNVLISGGHSRWGGGVLEKRDIGILILSFHWGRKRGGFQKKGICERKHLGELLLLKSWGRGGGEEERLSSAPSPGEGIS